jgi:hypothetical protein
MNEIIKEVSSTEGDEMTKVMKKVAKEWLSEKLTGKEPKGDTPELTSDNRDKNLLEFYLFNDPPMHIRRTLDQFHYYMTDDTDARDDDQVISRYFIRRLPETPVPIMMVDQLWMWIVNESM